MMHSIGVEFAGRSVSALVYLSGPSRHTHAPLSHFGCETFKTFRIILIIGILCMLTLDIFMSNSCAHCFHELFRETLHREQEAVDILHPKVSSWVAEQVRRDVSIINTISIHASTMVLISLGSLLRLKRVFNLRRAKLLSPRLRQVGASQTSE